MTVKIPNRVRYVDISWRLHIEIAGGGKRNIGDGKRTKSNDHVQDTCGSTLENIGYPPKSYHWYPFA